MTSRVEEIKFLHRYTSGNAVQVGLLAAWDKVIAPCSCGIDGCSGWQMIGPDSDHAERGVPVLELVDDPYFDEAFS